MQTKNEEFILSYYKKFLERIKKLVGTEIKENTYAKFVYTGRHLEFYLKWNFNKTDLSLGELNLRFLEDFDYYLKTEKKHKQITVNKEIQRLRTPIKRAISEGYLDRDPFILYKSKTVRKEVIFLSTEELNTIEEAVLLQNRLSVINDLFIFCCYTRWAYNEMRNLQRSNIQKGFDGVYWIQMQREKTLRQISIPILPKAQKIIDKYASESNRLFPVISNQKFNSYLKEIAILTKIEKIFSVLYRNNPPEIAIGDMGLKNDGLIFKMTDCKSKRWEYEQEYRIVADKFGKQPYNYKAVKSIYFGIRMEASQKSKMMKQLSDRNIKFYKIQQLAKSYKFIASPVKKTFSTEVKYMTEIPAFVTGREAVKFIILEQYFIKLTSKGNITIEIESIISEKEIK